MFCKNCGTKIGENVQFCPKCGNEPSGTNGFVAPQSTIAVNTASMQQQAYNTSGKLHCPKCKSSNIQVTTESSITGAVSAHHGAMTTSHVSNNHQTFWVCSDCGAKFRNIQSLEEEIIKHKNSHIWLFVFSAISAALFIFFMIQFQKSDLGSIIFLPFVLGTAVGGIMFLISGFISLNKIKKMISELEYLKVNCFN